MNQVWIGHPTASFITSGHEEPGSIRPRCHIASGIHHDDAHLMMGTPRTKLIDSEHDFSNGIEERSSPSERFHCHETRADTRDQFSGSRRRSQPHPRLDEEAMPGDRRVADPPRHLKWKSTGRTARREVARSVTTKDANRVVASWRGTFTAIVWTKKPSTRLGAKARILRTEAQE